jgi:Ca2+-binding EF-hand superfamily protein
MGCGHSRVMKEYTSLRVEKMTKFTPLFDLLQFPKKKRLEIYDVFWRFDKDGSGSIDFREFCQSFDIDRSAFAKRSFMMLDSGGTGEINFPQFVVACWNYCTYDKIGLASFAYMLYDPHRKGNIELKEMFQLLEDVYGFSKRGAAMDSQGTVNVVKNSPEYYMIQAKRGLKQCAGEDQLVSMVEFVNYSRTHPNLLQRPHTLQHKLQKTLGGEQFWAELTKIRRTMEKRAGVRGLNMLDAEVVISWLERETGTNLRSTNKPRKMKTTPGAVKHGGGNPYRAKSRSKSSPGTFDADGNESDVRSKKRKATLKRMNSAMLIQKVARKAVVAKKRREGRLHPHNRLVGGEWEERKDKRKGDVYYYNVVTKEKRKDCPEEAKKGKKKKKKSSGPSNEPLPKHWREMNDKKTGHTYYYNRLTKRSSWTRPEE